MPSGGMLSRFPSGARDRLQQAARGDHTAEGFSSNALKEMIGSVRSDRAGLAGLRDQSRVSEGNLVNRMRRRGRSAVSSAVAQSGDTGQQPATFGASLSDALRRTKMRTRMNAQGDAAIEQQGLRNRVAEAMASREREGSLINAMGQARNIRDGVNQATADANASISASKAGAWGAVGGAAVGAAMNGSFSGLFNRNPASVNGGVPMAGGTNLNIPPGYV